MEVIEIASVRGMSIFNHSLINGFMVIQLIIDNS